MPKILVIDDSGFQRKVLSSILAGAGYQVVTAEDGEAGFEMARREAPDLVICDLLMPGIDGYTFLKMAREGGSTPPSSSSPRISRRPPGTSAWVLGHSTSSTSQSRGRHSSPPWRGQSGAGNGYECHR